MKKLLALLAVVIGCSGGSLEAFDEGEVVKPDDSSATVPIPVPVPNAPPPSASAAKPDAKDAADAATKPPAEGSDAGVPLACPGGVPESEPNDATAKATSIVEGKTCGVVGPNDVDFFVIDLNGTASLRFDAASDDVEFFMVDDEGGGDIPLFAGDEITMTASGKTFFRIVSKTKQSYTITRQ